MPKDVGYGYIVELLTAVKGIYDEVLNITEEDEVLEENGGFVGWSACALSEQKTVDQELSSVKVWAVRLRGDGPTPAREIRGVSESHTAEDIPPATGGPRSTD